MLIYAGLLLFGTYFININISKTLCSTQNVQWGQVFFLTVLPWIIIFALIYFLLNIFPGWVKPFSNTIGYFVVKALGVEKDLKPITDNTQPSLTKAIEKINQNKAKFINEIDENKDKFLKFVEKLEKERFITGEDDDKVYKIYQHVCAKHEIGKVIWYILAGTLISSVTYNHLVNIECEKTPEEAQEEYDRINASSYVSVYGRKWRKVKDVNEDDILDNIPKLKNKSNYTPQLSGDKGFIQTYGDYFHNIQVNEIVSFNNDQLRQVRLSTTELPRNIYIIVHNQYFIPIE